MTHPRCTARPEPKRESSHSLLQLLASLLLLSHHTFRSQLKHKCIATPGPLHLLFLFFGAGNILF